MTENFAQSMEMLPGGWAGAGLLGLVLGWLMMKHLPEKDRQMAGLLESHARFQETQRHDYEGALEKQLASHERVISGVVEHCRDENDKVLARMDGLAGKLDRLIDVLTIGKL